MNKKFVVGFFIVSIVLLVGIVSYLAVPQLAIGYTPSLASCNERVASWCADGYACSSCSKQTLGYYLQFSTGSTNIVYSADCIYGSANTDSGHTACLSSSNVVSHARTHCYSGNVYWFNSLNEREGLKTSCAYGCEDYTLDSARCKSAPTVTPPVVTPPSCSNGCSSNGLSECTGEFTFRTCGNFDSDSCLEWDSNRFCIDNKKCEGGVCVAYVVPVVPVCAVTTECISDAQYRVTADDCSYKDYACDDGESCTDGECVAIPPITGDVTAPAVCDDFCDGDYTLHYSGFVDGTACAYSVELMSARCLPQASNGTVTNPLDTVDVVNVNHPSFLKQYGLWIFGGIFIVALVMFIRTSTFKKGGRK
jgi:hypothetical protein